MDDAAASRRPPLSPLELTGRACSHVVELAGPACTLHRDVVPAWLALRAAAAREAIDLVPCSSFRDFNRQLRIWNAKFAGELPLLDATGVAIDRESLDTPGLIEAILRWSALPGASRHHWGTDIDVFDHAALAPGQRPALIPAEYAAGGVFGRLSAWLDAHAGEFGFYRPYDRDRGGVQPEPWHLSHAAVAGEAQILLTPALLGEALRGAPMAGLDAVLERLAGIHARYVRTVATPTGDVLAVAGRFSLPASSS
jgi:LAS superfamily LD-carboxypeptidase LdcB